MSTIRQTLLMNPLLLCHLSPLLITILHTDNEFFFVEPDAKLTKVAPEGWKDDPKKKKLDVPFNLFLRIKFFLDDVNLIQ